MDVPREPHVSGSPLLPRRATAHRETKGQKLSGYRGVGLLPREESTAHEDDEAPEQQDFRERGDF